jgi:hypothetical protein
MVRDCNTCVHCDEQLRYVDGTTLANCNSQNKCVMLTTNCDCWSPAPRHGLRPVQLSTGPDLLFWFHEVVNGEALLECEDGSLIYANLRYIKFTDVGDDCR